MARSPAFPFGSWPLEMRAERAAAFCDEPSVETFLRKVEAGEYPAPLRRPGSPPKWHRIKLEKSISERHGVEFDGPAVIENLADLV